MVGASQTKAADKTREAWLVEAATLMTPWLREVGAGAIPQYRLSVGWPLGRKKVGGKGSHAIGQCFSHLSSIDAHHEIFISPELSEPKRVLDVLLHELVHAYVGLEAKHGKEFKLIATKVGLEGKMTATVASPRLNEKFDVILPKLGVFPHAALSAGHGMTPKQTTRLIKVTCPACGYVVRTTQKWIDVGLPICQCGMEFSLDNA